MKIVLISMARRGGMVHFLAELANALAPLCEITVVMSTAADESYFASKINRVRIDTGQDAPRRLLQTINPATWYRLLRVLRGLEADVIHIVGAHPWNPAIALLCRSLGSPLVYTVHDPVPHPKAPLSIATADRAAAKLADELIVMTRHGRAWLLRQGWSKGAVSAIPHPAYTLFRRWRPRTAAEHRTILYFGRIEAYKGLEVLVEAFRRIRRHLPGWKLIIAGYGGVPPSIVASRGGDLQVRNRYISDREASRLMHNATIVVLPYTSATQSGVAALAQAFGRPIIASAVGGLKDMVIHGKTGLLLPPGDVAALADAIRRLAQNRKRLAAMRRSTAQMSRTIWSPRAVAAAHVRVYRRALRARAAK
jgi:glycosyltransferase involved in cell wall biosynthesis